MKPKNSKHHVYTLDFAIIAGSIRVAFQQFPTRHVGGNTFYIELSEDSGVGRRCAAESESCHYECSSEEDFSFHSNDLL